MNRLALLTLLIPLAGCELFDQVKEEVDGATNPLVGLGMLIGVEPPQGDGLDLTGTPLAGAQATFFFADAASVDDLESAPVTDATVTLEGGQGGAVEVPHLAQGNYVVEPGDAFEYEDDGAWFVVVDRADALSEAALGLPAAPVLTVSEDHTANTELVVGVEGDFDSLLGLVVDLSSGQVTWTNKPEDVREAYDFTQADGDTAELVVPAEAFPGDAVYALGVAGMVGTESEDLTEMNTLLTTLMAGKMRVVGVSTLQAR